MAPDVSNRQLAVAILARQGSAEDATFSAEAMAARETGIATIAERHAAWPQCSCSLGCARWSTRSSSG